MLFKGKLIKKRTAHYSIQTKKHLKLKYQSRLQETLEPRSLYCRNSKPETSRGRARGRVFIVVAKVTNCDNVQNIEERKKMLVDKRLCFNCTGVQVTRRKYENQVRLQI